MDQTDKENLQFLLASSNDQLQIWWEKITEDEKDYALSLIKNYRRWLEDNSPKKLEKLEKNLGPQKDWVESAKIIDKIKQNL